MEQIVFYLFPSAPLEDFLYFCSVKAKSVYAKHPHFSRSGELFAEHLSKHILQFNSFVS